MSKSSTVSIAPIRVPDDLDIVRRLFGEYLNSLAIDLSFQDVDTELAALPGKYAPPAGMILIARDIEGLPLGCVALRPLAEPGTCEIKRLYVRPQARGHDLGRRLAQGAIAYAKEANYSRILLDTLAPMRAAQKLYASLGFRPIEPYYANPMPGTIYMALDI
jgi:ribosomal protein S18 acetylase RimI-like enzyme